MAETATPAMPVERVISVTLDKATVEAIVDFDSPNNAKLVKVLNGLWEHKSKKELAQEFGVKITDVDNHSGYNDLKKLFTEYAKAKYPNDDVKMKFVLRFPKRSGGGRTSKIACRPSNVMEKMLARLV